MSVHTAGSSNIVVPATVTVGTTAVQALKKNKNRAGYRVIAPIGNADNLYHGHNSLITTSGDDVIVPGGRLTDEGDWNTIYRGEVWLISGTAGQTANIEEIIKL